MSLRKNFGYEWAIAVRDAIREKAKTEYPAALDRFPLLKGFKADLRFIRDEGYLVVILSDAAGVEQVNEADNIPVIELPEVLKGPLSESKLEDWESFFGSVFNLLPPYVVVLIPAIDSSISVSEDLKLWSQRDKELWEQQISWAVEELVSIY